MKHSCLIIAGEKSGEEHAMSFLPALKKQLPGYHFFGVGGDNLKEEGVELLYHLDEFSTWGVSEAIGKVPFYLNSSKVILKKVSEYNCKSAILIDFQTFNLKLAEKLSEQGVSVQYYVAPQAWAWKSWRTKNLVKFVNTLYCIIPFEKKWFFDRGVRNTISVNHPLKFHYEKELENFDRSCEIKTNVLNILVLPGSRNNEVQRILPVFMDALEKINIDVEVKLTLVQSKSVNQNLFTPYISKFDRVYQDQDLTQAIKNADICLAASGTVTLATALFSLPTIVGYAGGLLNTFIYENFISYRGYISLANIVHEKEIFPELVAERFSSFNVKSALEDLLNNKERYKERVTQLKETLPLISGENIDIPEYLSKKLEDAYEL